MSKPILVANWKNHPGSLAEAGMLLGQLSRDSRNYKKVALFVAPPLTYFELVSRRISHFGHLASQNIFPLPLGSYTGQVTPDILKSFGVRLTIIGHSELRQLGETSEQVAKKVKIALRSGIIPLVCIGEKERDTDGEYFEFLREELKNSLAGLKRLDARKIMIAYEPIWAIGKMAKDALSTEALAETVIFIRKVLADLFGRSSAESIPILYGGSAEPNNVLALFRETGIRGFLVGHASLNAKSFGAIAKSLMSK